MLNDFDKGFSLFAILTSSNMALIESVGDGCTPRIRIVSLQGIKVYNTSKFKSLVKFSFDKIG